MSKFFEALMESVQQMDEIVRGERAPSREFHVDAIQVKQVRLPASPSLRAANKTLEVAVGR
ncbi:hypothetical protein KCU57_14870 [Xanthomonas translucens]|uniref:hypothetical protein n=1 Tax=Xanthomonas campestris pv. translucens TaxID=343 RepID=UPI001F2C852E|nr:hypothetical protein [Xanthomonas translucens]UKE49990.1 hypothetical protein KCU57_14870 [Xanthomonas translucens]